MKAGTRISVVLFEIDTETGLSWPYVPKKKSFPAIKRRFVAKARVVGGSVAPDVVRFVVEGPDEKGDIRRAIRLDREGIEWAKGWKTEAARALRVAVALS